MCHSSGAISLHQDCPMCLVFPHSKCPHVKDTCYNRALHPRMDVVYIKNAEVERFNGCGYCKWAKATSTPSPEFSFYKNPGWPGCCRAPTPAEYRSIPVAEWRAVSIVHQIPIPPDIKAVLDSLSPRVGPPPPTSGVTTPRTSRPVNDRKNSGRNSPSSRPPALAKSATPVRNRPSPSPQTTTPNLSRSSSSTAISSSVPGAPSVDYSNLNERRQRGLEYSERRIEGVHSLNSSPNRKNVDLDNASLPKRGSSMRRPTVTPATTSVSVSKVVVNGPSSSNSQNSASGRKSISKPEKPTTPPTPSRPSQPSRPTLLIPPSDARRRKEDDISSASSSSGSSDGMGSLSDSTVTSDGGFTDYLSDESEAELQRQAEAKAALLALNMAEELEFKAARLQLAHVDLRPPKSWNPTNITNTAPSARTMARASNRT
ncbi:hypothetical protein CC2G_010648 [Coprinopsis cinerea AmutBmut pab1-1]|nr:hypothetical protein CC2G_010648 [Coprinopsis cinerea AmutBmut pab1-1]